MIRHEHQFDYLIPADSTREHSQPMRVLKNGRVRELALFADAPVELSLRVKRSGLPPCISLDRSWLTEPAVFDFPADDEMLPLNSGEGTDQVWVAVQLHGERAEDTRIQVSMQLDQENEPEGGLDYYSATRAGKEWLREDD